MHIVKYKHKITVFTPTYNRGYIIKNLYDSLKKQTIKDFEWIVIDDGSTDNTTNLFNEWINENNEFEIKYFKIKNGGKHRAINKGIDIADGELFFIVDSDDYLIEEAIEKILKWYKTVEKSSENFVGVAGLRGYTNKKYIGKTFKGVYLDATSLERFKFNILGDKAEVFKTDVIKKYKFPEIEGEKFISESIVWFRIADDDYKIRWFNEVIYIGDYLSDGLSKNNEEVFLNNFKGYTLQVKECIKYYKKKKISNQYFLHILTAYIYRSRIKKISFKNIKKNIDINYLNIFILTLAGIIYKKIKK